MSGKQKHELTWNGKENWTGLESGILLEASGKFSRAWHSVTDSDIFDNRPIIGYNPAGDMR